MGVVDKETRERMIREWQKQKEAMQEIEDMQKEVMKDYIQRLKIELEKKDKIIDLMAKWLYEDDTSFGYGRLKEVNTSEKIKQYFERKVENG